ncbi:hypothetical protein RRG08_047528 [Elysia crispata]|uniref:Uncharacterized protein n=1 Tax=Elysia crispata TaxID=231223 RepID=A0AAE0YNR0_9GAST|nr:hypothetical protein RRG08_047528 [Elysia crispata]
MSSPKPRTDWSTGSAAVKVQTSESQHTEQVIRHSVTVRSPWTRAEIWHANRKQVPAQTNWAHRGAGEFTAS